MADKNPVTDVTYGRDRLTGIYNFQMFAEKLGEMLHEHADREYVLIVWDIERFKVLNDLFGMETANQVLIEFAQNLERQMSGYGVCGRLGGDIFACSFENRYLNLEELEKKMHRNYEALHIDYKVISQAGIYVIDDIDIPVYQMFDRAKLALKTVKGKYDRRYAVYNSEMRKEILEEQEIIMDMERGLLEHQFYVEIQPIYDLESDKIVSGEALVRWKHPVKGVLPPGKFIPVFERNGMITKLDAYVWEEVCRLLHEMKEQGNKVVPVSVNVSRHNLLRETLCEEIMALTNKYQLDSSMIRLEITESAYMDNAEQLNGAIHKLQNSGFKILMDDFGSGYSSLNMLKDLSFDILKVDMRFIDDLDTSTRAANVVTSIIRMAKWLGMAVVAEGVEKKSQAVFLKSIGCDRVQGYYFSKPLAHRHFAELVDKEKHQEADGSELKDLDIDLDSILNSTDTEKRAFVKELVGALALYEEEDGELRLVKVNDSYYQLFETTPQKIFAERWEDKPLAPEDKTKILECCERAYGTRLVEQTEVCRYMGKKRMMWLHLRIKYVGTNNGKKVYYISFTDITKYHEMEVELKRKNYSEILCNVYQEILEMDYTRKKLSTVFHDGKKVKTRMDDMNISEGIRYYTERRLEEADRERVQMIFSEEEMDKFYTSEENSKVFQINVINNEGEKVRTEITIFKTEKEHGQKIFLVCNRAL